jgi:hypothetical protein
MSMFCLFQSTYSKFIILKHPYETKSRSHDSSGILLCQGLAQKIQRIAGISSSF